MNKLKVIFLGGRILGYKCLEVIAEKKYQNKIDLKFVIAHKKDGEKNSDWNPSLLPLARSFKFKTLKPQSLKDPKTIKIFKNAKPDIILNAFCNRIIPKEILDLPRLGVINFHYGKLPKYKGRFIVSHIIINGEKTTRATAHFMEEEVDSGDIIFESPVKVFPTDTAKTLYFRCTDKSVTLFRKVLDYVLEEKRLPRKKQQGVGNYYPFEEPNNCMLDLNWPKEKQARFIRGLTFPPISKPWVKIGDLEFDIILKQ